MRKQFINWVVFWTVSGVAIPLLVLAHMSASTGAMSGVEFVLWPTSIVFMGAPEGNGATLVATVEVYATAIGLNAVLYALVGLLTSPLFMFVQKLRRRAHISSSVS